jgi:hypothetical protein
MNEKEKERNKRERERERKKNTVRKIGFIEMMQKDNIKGST